ncbi:MAG: hypothetical protein ACI4EU_02995 [Butyrivibrio sp.]
MLTQIISIVSVCISLTAVICTIYNSKRGNKRTDVKDIEEKVKAEARTDMKLDMINSTVQDIKSDVSSLREEIKSHNDRLIKVEESVKQAHHRLNTIEDRINKESD